MTIKAIARVVDVCFEHFRSEATLGIDEVEPRISWRLEGGPEGMQQEAYEIEVVTRSPETSSTGITSTRRVTSTSSVLVPWPLETPLSSRQQVSVRVRVQLAGSAELTTWSDPASAEIGLSNRKDWVCHRISAPWAADDPEKFQPEDLFRKSFELPTGVLSARLYVTCQGVYEAELNSQRIGDFFLAPGWAAYDNRLAYQTYDVTDMLSKDSRNNTIGIRVAEGWFKGRIGFEGGERNLWGNRTALLAQLEVTLHDGSRVTVASDASWCVARGPIRQAEIYDGETYDATTEVTGCWSGDGIAEDEWASVEVMSPLPEEVHLERGDAEAVRRIGVIQPAEKIFTPSGKVTLDFGQNLVGYVRVKKVEGPRGHTITLSHAEVLEDGELGVRPLRICKAQDRYVLRGAQNGAGESYEPRFTFHGFRYAQIDNWPSAEVPLDAFEAVVCHTDMQELGHFSCSDDKVNKLMSNVRWSMRGNFLSVPTDCPQRDERLGWTGDLALFIPTATFLYGCAGMLKDWLRDLWHDQQMLDGLPPMVTPNVLLNNAVWGKRWPLAVWHDVTILAPWALWQETGDLDILAQQYQSMEAWLAKIPKNKEGPTHLWDMSAFQLGDWLDPSAPPSEPLKTATDGVLVANAFLVNSLSHMVHIAGLLGHSEDKVRYRSEHDAARAEFAAEYISPSGRLVSDSQTAYALAICFDLFSGNKAQLTRAGDRLAEIVTANRFRVATGFAGTPFVCEALTLTGHVDVAYSMLLNEQCPSWLYPITKGATTIWERWDSMLPDGRINPGEMTSFNHYAYGAVAKFMVERLAGLQRLEPAWRRSRVQPEVEGPFTWARADHLTPYGRVASSWRLEKREAADGSGEVLTIDVIVPPGTEMDVVIPDSAGGSRTETVGAGSWTFTGPYLRRKGWPVVVPNPVE